MSDPFPPLPAVGTVCGTAACEESDDPFPPFFGGAGCGASVGAACGAGGVAGTSGSVGGWFACGAAVVAACGASVGGLGFGAVGVGSAGEGALVGETIENSILSFVPHLEV